MAHNYDNWERLVESVLDREHLREIALCSSIETSSISDSESSSLTHSLSSSSTFYYQRPDRERHDRLPTPLDHSDLMRNYTDWKALLPPGEKQVVWRSAALSFSLDKRSKKNCFMVGARGLEISGEHEWAEYHESRFLEVAQVNIENCGSFHLNARIEVERLSSVIHYGSYLVFKPIKEMQTGNKSGVKVQEDVELNYELYKHFKDSRGAIRFIETVNNESKRGIITQIKPSGTLKTVRRPDGWMEAELGHFFVDSEWRGEVVEGGLRHAQKFCKTTLGIDILLAIAIEGVEFRPLSSSVLKTLARLKKHRKYRV